MKKLFLAAAILAINFTLPLVASAGSCFCANFTYSARNTVINQTNKCYDGTTYDGGYPPSPNGKKEISSQADCNGTIDLGMAGAYSNCTYSPSSNCANQCVADGQFKSDKTCSNAADCPSVSGSNCCEGICFYNNPSEASGGFYRSQPSVKINAPVLSVTIPNVVFSKPNTNLDANGNLRIPYLAEYITGVYRFAIIAGSLVAVIVIILNGFRITISAGGQEKNKGVQNIVKSITGLFILWSSYALFYIINPSLTEFSALKIQYIQPAVEETEEDVTTGTATPTSSLVKVSGTNISKGSDVTLDPNILEMVRNAALSLRGKEIILYVASGYRSLEKQKDLIKENCQNDAGAPTCKPKNGRPPTCILKDLDPKNCPHTTGKAVDVWGMKNGVQCIKQAECSRDPNSDACRENPCQADVIAAMKAAGFCNLSSEAWHFEYPKMSARCDY